MTHEVENKLTYIIYCVGKFGEKYGLSPQQSYKYLRRHNGIDFLDECYEAEHQLSLDDAVEDLSVICKRNGGGIG